MVQILREQARQYTSDQSGAIRQQGLVNNIGSLSNIVSSSSKIIGGIQDYNKTQAQNADEQMINTQIGSSGANALKSWATTEIENGVDPTTEDFQKRLEAKRLEIYQPLLDQMTSDKGRVYLEAQGVKERDSIIRSGISKIAQNRKKAQAQVAFVNTAKNVNTDAREYGKLGEWESFKEDTKEDRKALSDYAKSNLGANADKVIYAMDMRNLENFALGQAESNPEEIVKVFGTKADYKDIKSAEYADKLSKTNEKTSDFLKTYLGLDIDLSPYTGSPEEVAEELSEEDYNKGNVEEYSMQKRLEYLPAEAVKQATDSFVKSKKQEKQELEKELKNTAKGSKHYDFVSKKIDEVQEQMDNPEKYVVDAMTNNIRKSVVPIAKEQIGRNKLAEKQLEKESEIYTYRAVLNPDTSVSFPVQMMLSVGKEQTEEMYQMSFPDDEIKKSYDAFAQAKVATLTREYETVEGTEAMIEAYKKVLNHDPADQLGAIKEVFDGYVALRKAPVTQRQADNYQNAMYAALQDGAFADLMRSFTSLKDIYTPDTSWWENAMGRADAPAVRTVSDSPLILDPANIDFYSRSRQDQETLENYDETVYNMPEGVRLAKQGLVSPAIMAQDKDTVEKYFRNKVVDITNKVGGMFALAATQEDPEARRLLGQKAIDYYTTEKRKAFDYAVQNFGIDMASLREAYKSGREVITQLGRRRCVYKGDDPSTGLPNFAPYDDEAETKAARDRMLDSAKMI